MITPFTADGRVDYEALGRMIDYVIEGGADYIVALGTTAETPDALHSGARRRGHVHCQSDPPPRAAGDRRGRQLDLRGARPAARVRPARRRRHPERDALLQQTVAGGTLPTLQGRVGTLATADHPLQHRRPHGRQHDPPRRRCASPPIFPTSSVSRRRRATSARFRRSSTAGAKGSSSCRATTGSPST